MESDGCSSPTLAPADDALGVLRWFQSFPTAVHALVTGRVRRRYGLVDVPLTMSDGRVYVPFRETVKLERDWAPGSSAVLHPRFHLRMIDAHHRFRHALFRRVCIVTTPFFVGLPGFRSKLWMVDEGSGDFAGLYEWDSAEQASAYAEGLVKVLRPISRPGSVTYELVAGTTVPAYLAATAERSPSPDEPRAAA